MKIDYGVVGFLLNWDNSFSSRTTGYRKILAPVGINKFFEHIPFDICKEKTEDIMSDIKINLIKFNFILHKSLNF